ncbi:hypothetical protein DIPPA_24769 [Diplonema papillatum]|nr:hypothetical protein DIPPA_24769 [Diplonema papillatum]
MLATKAVAPETVFAIWFSLGLTQPQNKQLKDALRELVSSECETIERRLSVAATRATWALVKRVFEDWLRWDISWEQARTMNEGRKERSAYAKGANADSLFMMLATGGGLGALSQLQDSELMKELAAYCGNFTVQAPGVSVGATECCCGNVTMFTSDSEFTLHYGSCVWTAFSLNTFKAGGGERPLTRCVYPQFERWVASSREVLKVNTDKPAVLCEFDVSDALLLCQNLVGSRSGLYDVVTTSNVADVVGILALLCHVRPLLRETGYALLETLFNATDQTPQQYLGHELHMPPGLWPFILGWRCIEHPERGTTPVACDGQWERTPPAVQMNPNMLKGRHRHDMYWCTLLPGALFNSDASEIVSCILWVILAQQCRPGNPRTAAPLLCMLRLLPLDKALALLKSAPYPSDELCALAELPVVQVRASPSRRVYSAVWGTVDAHRRKTSMLHWIAKKGDGDRGGELLSQGVALDSDLVVERKALGGRLCGMPALLCRETKEMHLYAAVGAHVTGATALRSWSLDSKGALRLEVGLSASWMACLNGGATLKATPYASQQLFEVPPAYPWPVCGPLRGHPVVW